MTSYRIILVLVLGFVLFPSMPGHAQELSPSSETTRFVLDTGIVLAGSFGLLLAYAGFCLRDIGLARTITAPGVCLRMMGAIAVAAIAMWLCGFQLMVSVEDGGLLGEFQIWQRIGLDTAQQDVMAAAAWLFMLSYCLIGLAVISGAVSERVKLWPFLVICALFSTIVFPVVVGWTWQGGFFNDEWRFIDRMGAGVLHISAGAAAVASALVVGPRPGKYNAGNVRIASSTALPLSALGALFILVGFLMGFAGALGEASSYEAIVNLTLVFSNAIIGAAGGILTALSITKFVYKRAGLVSAINGMIGALVALSGDPISPELWQALMLGAASGVIVTVAPPFLDRLRIDDAVFSGPVHLLCGILGVMAVAWTNDQARILDQSIAAIAIAGYSFLLVMMGWAVLRYTVGVRHVLPDEQILANDGNG